MNNHSLQHDHAWVASQTVVKLFVLRPEEEREAFAAVYERIMAMLQSYDTQSTRFERLLSPSEN